MNKINIHFRPNDILQKDFRRRFKGYDPVDVDSFLDLVIRDYKTFQSTIQNLYDKNIELRNQNQKLRTQLGNPNIPQSTPQPASNPDTDKDAKLSNISQRLDKIEQYIKHNK